MSANVKQMLQAVDRVLFTLTDQRLKVKLNRDGQISYPFKVKDVFDSETQDFISQYLRLGSKRAWFENSCFVSFKLSGEKKEMLLYGSEDKR